MKNSLFRPFLSALLLATPLMLASCDDDKNEPEPEEEEELITTVRYTLTPSGGGPAVTAEYKDLDGSGGNAPTVGTLRLVPNTTYTGTVVFLNETKNPAEDITAEVAAEKDEHLVVYEPNPVGLLTITRTDRDSRNLEVGLATTLRANAAATGSLKITLRHQPGTKNGTAGPGSSDVEATIPVTVQ
ncbi:hypothetical protein [Hymenobacter koreensis]|uniref:Type 1 periplasmic binding fold superfamily protein n=1 Tax=Hymenobacter koreensis TaxID=1084523 RepID=A0ABP8IY99_9BACT